MMDPEVMQQLRVDDPMEEPELNLDGLEISSIQVLLEPPPGLSEDDTDVDDEDNFYSPLDHFQNLVKLSMSSAQCQSLEAFPNLPLLRSLMLADNNLAGGFEALAEADLQNLVRLDLSGNNISDLDVLKPLVALGNLQHLMLSENEVVAQEDYRDAVFEILPQLISVDGLDRDATEIDVDDDVTLLSGDEEGHDIEDIGSQSDSDLEDQENRPPPAAGKGKTVGIPLRADDDEEDDDELEDEEDEDEEEEEDEYEGEGQSEGVRQHQRGPASDEEEDDDDDEVDDEEEEDDEEEDDEEEEGGEAPGLAYLLSENIQDDNDEEFEPTNEVDEVSEMESSDEDEAGGNTNTNGHRSKRPRSPSSTTAPLGFDQAGGGFDVDGEDDDTTNGFGMASFDGPATFDDETTHEAKRPRT